jgi:hypothetical protein
MAASHQLLHHSTALDLALIVYSFAALGVRPPEVWWTRFWSASAVVMGDAGSQALSNMFWGLGRLKKVCSQAASMAMPFVKSIFAATQCWQCSARCLRQSQDPAGKLKLIADTAQHFQ